MAGIVLEPWLEWGLGEEGGRAPRPPGANMLAAHDAVTTNSPKAQQILGKLVNPGRHAAHTASLDQLPDTARPPGPGDPLRGCETKALTKARYRSLKGAGAMPSGEANRLAPCHAHSRVRRHGKTLLGDRGARGSTLPLL